MPVSSATPSIGSLMAAFREGDKTAGGQLIELFYPELKRLAARQLNGVQQCRSWQPTLLVNELYLQLARSKPLSASATDCRNDKGTFFAFARQVMRRLVIHHGRPLSSRAQKVPLFEEAQCSQHLDFTEVEIALSQLEAIRPVLRRVVEMKVFEGMSAEEIAARLGCATVTVNRYWQFSRHWLRKELIDARCG